MTSELYYAGYSYGTYLGATYAALCSPTGSARFLLDATVDPVAWSGTGSGDAAPSVPLGIRIRQGLGAHETFGEFTRLCAEAGPAACPLAALGDPATVAYATFDRLATQPVEVPLPDGTTVLVTQQVAVASDLPVALLAPPGQTCRSSSPRSLVPAPDPAAVASAGAGDPSRCSARGCAARTTRRSAEDSPACASTPRRTAASTATRRLIDAYDATAPVLRPVPRLGRPARASAGRSRTTTPSPGPWQQTTRAPVLVVGTRFDPATPYRQTRPYAKHFPDARLVTHESWGHPALNRSTCINDLIVQYLTAGQAPADGTTVPTPTRAVHPVRRRPVPVTAGRAAGSTARVTRRRSEQPRAPVATALPGAPSVQCPPRQGNPVEGEADDTDPPHRSMYPA